MTSTTSCFLCGADAQVRDTDHGNRKLYRCTSQSCGDYEISLRAMRRLEEVPAHKQQAMQQACALRGTDRLLAISVGLDNQVVAETISSNESGVPRS